jgi:Rhodopirellula transposase DDE domain
VRLWKRELQVLADELGITITVCHLPPGTSEWNRIEHRLFAFITQNWRGKPLVSHQVIVQLIANTQTKTGYRTRDAIIQAQALARRSAISFTWPSGHNPAGILTGDESVARHRSNPNRPVETNRCFQTD